MKSQKRNYLKTTSFKERMEGKLQKNIHTIGLAKDLGFFSSSFEHLTRRKHNLFDDYRKYRLIAKSFGISTKSYDNQMSEETRDLDYVPISNADYRHFFN